MPLTAKPGEKQKLLLRGKNLAAVTAVKGIGIDDMKVKLLSAKSAAVPTNYPADRVGDSEVEVELDLPRGAKPGEAKLIAVGGGGESTPYTLLIRDSLPAVVEKEPNDGFDQAQALTPPCAVEGTVKSERDVDVFQFAGKKGEIVVVEIQAAKFGSPLDPIVTVYDDRRRVVDSADATTGKPDPVVTLTLPRDGPYYISVMDANDLGGPNFGYRLIVRSSR